MAASMARRAVKPRKELESPFLAKHHHQLIARSNNSSVLEELYRFTIQMADTLSLEEVWVSSELPFVIKLKLRDIQQAVKGGEKLDSDCFNLAIRNMAREDVENFKNTKCLGWRHYVDSDWTEFLARGVDPTSLKTIFSRQSILYNASDSHLILIPVLHNEHWTLYAFNMSDRKLSILDSLPDPAERHHQIRPQVCDDLYKTMDTAFDMPEDDFRSWTPEFPEVPRQANSCDCGFFVFNFMRSWDGHRLIQSFPTESRELRKDFLACILSCKENGATLPTNVASWISGLAVELKVRRKSRQPWAWYPMHSRLRKAVIEGNLEAFQDLLDSEARNDTPPCNNASANANHVTANQGATGRDDVSWKDGANNTVQGAGTAEMKIDIPQDLELEAASSSGCPKPNVHAPATSGVAVPAAPMTPTGEAAAVLSSNSGAHADAPLLRSMLLRGVTSDADGVLHVAARLGHVDLVQAIFRKVGVLEEDEAAAAGAGEQRPPPPAPAAVEVPLPPTLTFSHQDAPCVCVRFADFLRARDHKGETCLHEAVRHGHTGLVRLLLSIDANLVRAIFRKLGVLEEDEAAAAGAGEQRPPPPAPAVVEVPLPLAVTFSHQDAPCVRFADFLRARNHKGETCLHEAVRHGHTGLVRLLLSVDANLDEDDGTSPALVRILDDEGVSPLYLATTLRHVDIVEMLTKEDYKYLVSYAGPSGKTALHAAVLLSTELCKLLLKWKESPTKKPDEFGSTPLHYLGTRGTAIAELILEKDTLSGYCADSEGSLPIHVAASKGRLDIIKKLLHKCPNCDSSCNALGRTFLHVAVDEEQFGVVAYVCSERSLERILNMRDDNGDTALHLAVLNGNGVIFCKLLRNKKVCLSFINKKGCTPLDLAFSSIKPGLAHKQFTRQWIRNDLLVAGADFCTYRWDHFSSKSAAMSEAGYEKESERISKSAGLLAAAAVLISAIAFQAPFNMADKKSLTANNVSPEAEHALRLQALTDIAKMDALSLFFSGFAILFCTFAGFPTSRLGARFVCLIGGGIFVFFATVAILLVFATGLSLVYPGNWRSSLFYYMVFIFAEILGMAAIMLCCSLIMMHAGTRCARLGFRVWCCSLFRRRPGASLTPLMSVLLLATSAVGTADIFAGFVQTESTFYHGGSIN